MDNYSVKPIPTSETTEWLLKKHYAHRLCSISHAYGLYESGQLIGVCTFGSPPSPFLCVGICGEEYRDIVIELNRLCLTNNKKNEASLFVGACLKLLPKPKIVVSYADTSKNHHGYIYQATNFIYTGLSAKRTERFDIDNPNRHSKSVVGSECESDNIGVRDRPQKHRYVYMCADKRDKKKLMKALKYPILPYPKGDNVRYDSSAKIDNIQQILF